ncbi:MAG: hypothetical protein KDC27_04390 [Acidobacteria bacterium]|nr:hypothetical protein [Acidobacteriota bacterium]
MPLEFIDFPLTEKPAPVQGPFATLAKGHHDTLYFSKEASAIIRAQKVHRVRLASTADGSHWVFRIEGGKGSLPLVESRKGRKGPGTFQVGGVRPFYEDQGLRDGERHVFRLDWNEEHSAFLYEPVDPKASKRGRSERATRPRFTPVEIRGEPLSKTVLDDRR